MIVSNAQTVDGYILHALHTRSQAVARIADRTASHEADYLVMSDSC